MQASVVWEHDLNFGGTAGSGALLPLASSISPGGGSFSPMELLLVGLAGCTAMDVISILKKKGQKISRFEVRVRAERASGHPRVFTRAALEYWVGAQGVDPATVVIRLEPSPILMVLADTPVANPAFDVLNLEAAVVEQLLDAALGRHEVVRVVHVPEELAFLEVVGYHHEQHATRPQRAGALGGKLTGRVDARQHRLETRIAAQGRAA